VATPNPGPASATTWRHAGGAIDCRRAQIVGILNSAPDSFSDPGGGARLDELVSRGVQLAAAGADIVEVGGQTLRDTEAISPEAEAERVVPLIERLRVELDGTIAIDTFTPSVAREAIQAGASILNDPTGLREPAMSEVAAAAGAGVVLTHFLGPPKQVPAFYPSVDLVGAISRWANASIVRASASGIRLEQIVLDPGIGLGTSPFQDLDVLRRLDELTALGRPLFLPVSNKKIIGSITGASPAQRRAGTAAGVMWGLLHGARIFRVHDVGFMRDVILVAEALATGRPRTWHHLPG
jgi:dihydropteroate synthase